jgi:phosphoglycolate phosphatase-like HAD superfamily hydrolase
VVPGQVVFVGDSQVDLDAARAAGVGKFVALKSSTCPDAVVDAADAVVETVEDLLKLNFER